MRAEQNFKWEKLSLGTCYYPEHWDKSLWRDDLRRMKENGIFTVRIAEFAWNKIEPAEGEFTYEFFDEFLDVAEEEQMKVIFGTPTATLGNYCMEPDLHELERNLCATDNGA